LSQEQEGLGEKEASSSAVEGGEQDDVNMGIKLGNLTKKEAELMKKNNCC